MSLNNPADLAQLESDIGNAGARLIAAKSEGGVVEKNQVAHFGISISDYVIGNVLAANIDITGISQEIKKATGGGAFGGSPTPPVFSKGDGLVFVNYQFLAAEWAAGDHYQLIVDGITATIAGDTVYIPRARWTNIVLKAEKQLYEQANVPVSVNAISGSETDIFDLNVASTQYLIRHLRLKAVDPGGDTITVRLRELINDVSTIVDTFNIDTANFGAHHALMDMFTLGHLAGGDLQVTVQTDSGTYAITGQYSYAKTNN